VAKKVVALFGGKNSVLAIIMTIRSPLTSEIENLMTETFNQIGKIRSEKLFILGKIFRVIIET
jgi:hypothetical protein